MVALAASKKSIDQALERAKAIGQEISAKVNASVGNLMIAVGVVAVLAVAAVVIAVMK